mmetsp:Transcript_21156/g.66926  ORF Transcript_21156/g.66926 Transcript_21156/m.66926 type:complete len:281 (-) Transcript_21156:826-1668(-)
MGSVRPWTRRCGRRTSTPCQKQRRRCARCPPSACRAGPAIATKLCQQTDRTGAAARGIACAPTCDSGSRSRSQSPPPPRNFASMSATASPQICPGKPAPALGQPLAAARCRLPAACQAPAHTLPPPQGCGRGRAPDQHAAPSRDLPCAPPAPALQGPGVPPPCRPGPATSPRGPAAALRPEEASSTCADPLLTESFQLQGSSARVSLPVQSAGAPWPPPPSASARFPTSEARPAAALWRAGRLPDPCSAGSRAGRRPRGASASGCRPSTCAALARHRSSR